MTAAGRLNTLIVAEVERLQQELLDATLAKLTPLEREFVQRAADRSIDFWLHGDGYTGPHGILPPAET